MTPQLPRIYTYKITFEEVPYYYYGWHKEKRFNEEYWGTPYTHKWCWEFYTPKKQILEVFEYSDEGYLKAQKIESRLIKPFMNTDSWCLNANCSGIISMEAMIKGGRRSGKISGKKSYELGLGVHGLTKEEKVENGKMGGKITGEKLAKEFTLVSPTGEVISGRNICQFCREYNLNQSHLSEVINGKRNSHKGYRRLETVPVPKVA